MLLDLGWLYQAVQHNDDMCLPATTQSQFPWIGVCLTPSVSFRQKLIRQAKVFENQPILNTENDTLEQERLVPCPYCGIRKTKKHMNGHISVAHRARNPVKMYMSATICKVCLTNFHTRSKLCHHVCYSSKCKCRPYYVQCVPSSPYMRNFCNQRRKLLHSRNPCLNTLFSEPSAVRHAGSPPPRPLLSRM